MSLLKFRKKSLLDKIEEKELKEKIKNSSDIAGEIFEESTKKPEEEEKVVIKKTKKENGK